jgi:glycosyltransferase involved in cell wall biosynthesis
MLQLTVWMNMPSFYQDDLFRALLASGEVDLRVVFAREIAAERSELGWKEELKEYPYRILPQRFAVRDCIRIALAERNRIHIVNGIWAESAFAATLCALVVTGSRFAIYAESPDLTQARPGLKRLVRKAFGGWVARAAAGMLAVSRFADTFYTQLGFCRERVYPFGYFRANLALPNSPDAPPDGRRTEAVFVGQISYRKGWDILLEALRPLFAEYPNLRLTVIGVGEDAAAFKSEARALADEGRVVFEGAVPSDRIEQRIATADLLILPSRWDGWGLVVNEAFSVGVPVIASDRCGAADLIRPGVNGFIFRGEDVEHLRACLRSFLDNPGERMRLRSAAAMTGRTISAEVAATYLIRCLKHMTGESNERPIPPWIELPVSQSTEH